MKNFQVWLFGVLHASPVSRRRYVSELESMTNNLGPPEFVAVEAAPRLFHNVVLDQRSRFRELASQDSRFNVDGDRYVQELSLCICFEADAHLEVTVDPPVVWLDQHRDRTPEDQGCVESLGRNYYIWFGKALEQTPLGCSRDEANTLIHKYFTEHKEATKSDTCLYRRDATWCEMVYHKVDTPGQSAYGVVVVGLNHINDHKLSVRNLLEQRGLRCEVVDLSTRESGRWSGQAS